MRSEKKLSLTVSPDETGTRLDKFLGNLAEIGSRSRAEQLIEKGFVLVNGKVAKPSSKISISDKIEVTIPPSQKDSPLTPLELKLDVIFEDSELIVLNKPAGLVVHPAAGHANDTLVNALLHHTKDLAVGFEEKRPGIVHRLDRDTSGLLVIAKTDEAHRDLTSQFKQKTTHRIYWAIVFGVPKASTGRIESKLARHPTDRKRFKSTTSEGKTAITHYKVIKSTTSKDMSLVQLRLETGRTHQIRVHMSELGHAIVGDTIYGSSSRIKNVKSQELRKLIAEMPRFALHAAELGFVHPTTKKNLIFKCDWPDDLNPLLELSGLE